MIHDALDLVFLLIGLGVILFWSVRFKNSFLIEGVVIGNVLEVFEGRTYNPQIEYYYKGKLKKFTSRRSFLPMKKNGSKIKVLMDKSGGEVEIISFKIVFLTICIPFFVSWIILS